MWVYSQGSNQQLYDTYFLSGNTAWTNAPVANSG